jgi:hypothetical protein
LIIKQYRRAEISRLWQSNSSNVVANCAALHPSDSGHSLSYITRGLGAAYLSGSRTIPTESL